MTTEDTIKKIIAEALDVDVEKITDDLAINGIQEWNSIGNVAIITALEEKLGISIPIEDLFDLTSVEGIIEEIAKLEKENA
jgi:acyl carrier protein